VAAPREAMTWVSEVTSAADSSSSSTASAHTFALGPLKKGLPFAGTVEPGVWPPKGGAGPPGPESDGEIAIAEAGPAGSSIDPNEVWGTQLGEGPHAESRRGLVSEVAAVEEVVAEEAREAPPCGGAGPGSRREPSSKEVASSEVEDLEVVYAVVPDACCFSCADWQAAKRYRCLKKDPPLAAATVGLSAEPCPRGDSPDVVVMVAPGCASLSNSPNISLTVTWDASVCPGGSPDVVVMVTPGPRSAPEEEPLQQLPLLFSSPC
jgi:hypothetical protein